MTKCPAKPAHLTQLILAYRQSNNGELLPNLIPFFAFKPVKNQEGELEDANLVFRTEIVEALLYDFTKTDRPLIKSIFTEELKCEEETWIHDNLYQLCFYLYTIGDLEVYLICMRPNIMRPTWMRLVFLIEIWSL